MVPDHWSNDAMVSMDRCGLHRFKELQQSNKKRLRKKISKSKLLRKQKNNVKSKNQPDQEKGGEDVMRENVEEAENPHDYIDLIICVLQIVTNKYLVDDDDVGDDCPYAKYLNKRN